MDITNQLKILIFKNTNEILIQTQLGYKTSLQSYRSNSTEVVILLTSNCEIKVHNQFNYTMVTMLF